MTARQLIYRAMRLCNGGLRRPGRVVSSEEGADGLARLNAMINAWGVEPLTMYYMKRTLKLLEAGRGTYTIGTGGDIDIVRPDKIDQPNLIIDTSGLSAFTPVDFAEPDFDAEGAQPRPTEIGLVNLTNQQWESIPQKNLPSPLAQAIYYDRGWTDGLGIIFLWPIPSVGTTALVLYTMVAVTEFPDQTTNVTLPNGYEEALQYNLALRMAPEFDGLRDPTLTTMLAREALMKIKRANIKPVTLAVDSALQSPRDGVWDWRTGTIRGLD